MFTFTKFLMGTMLLMDKAGDDKGGGGNGDDKGKDSKSGDDISSLKAANESLLKRLEALEGKGKQDQGSDDDLLKKAEAERKAKESKGADSKSLESALKFTIAAPEWLKTNLSLLPKDVEGIFSAAAKESYDDEVQKACAIKSGVVQSFFKVQENMDLLTSAQKIVLDDWLKLTKTGREEKAQAIYDSIFEPSFEMLKRLKKAATLSQSGARNSDDAETAYKTKLISGSKKHYLGDKT